MIKFFFKKLSKPKANLDPDNIAIKTVKERECYGVVTSAYPLFKAWEANVEFSKKYKKIQSHTLVSKDRCYILNQLASYALSLEGDFAECGVYRGGTAWLLASLLTSAQKKIILFDSFEGLPEPKADRDNFYKKGKFSSSLEIAQDFLKDFQQVAMFEKGWIPETFEKFSHWKFSFIHIDVDFYQPSMDCCSFFYPRMVKGGVIIFDDYGFPSCRGEKEAVDEFFKNLKEPVIVLPTGQAMVIKL